MPATDKEGYLENLADWSEDVAGEIACAEGIELTEAHWEIVKLAREFYVEFDHSPAMRPLIKRIKNSLGAKRGTSIYLHQLFPGAASPAKTCAKIAGLPRPTNCL